MRTFTVHLHTNHQRTIDRFILSMLASGFYFVSASMETATGTHYLRFSQEVRS